MALKKRRLHRQEDFCTNYVLVHNIPWQWESKKKKKWVNFCMLRPFFQHFFLFPGRSHKRKLSEGKEVLSKKSILSASKPTELPAAADHYCITVGLFWTTQKKRREEICQQLFPSEFLLSNSIDFNFRAKIGWKSDIVHFLFSLFWICRAFSLMRVARQKCGKFKIV